MQFYFFYFFSIIFRNFLIKVIQKKQRGFRFLLLWIEKKSLNRLHNALSLDSFCCHSLKLLVKSYLNLRLVYYAYTQIVRYYDSNFHGRQNILIIAQLLVIFQLKNELYAAWQKLVASLFTVKFQCQWIIACVLHLPKIIYTQFSLA